MTDAVWLEGLAADCAGAPLPDSLAGWREDLPDTLRELVNRVATAGGGIWLVGGSVREALLGRGAYDHDLATTLHPDQVIEIFPRAIPTGAAFGTVTVRIGEDSDHYEVTTLRSEGTYGDGRRPDKVDYSESLLEDLSRRDFTINAIAVDLARSQIHDPFGGMDDLDEQVLQAVGIASERLGEDGLRLMRGYRFMDQGAQGVWAPDPALSAALIECGHMLQHVAAERVWSEFKRILAGWNAAQVLERMRVDGMLSRIFPGWDADLAAQHVLRAPKGEAAICRLVLLAADVDHARWRRLDHDMRELTLSNRDREHILEVHRLLGQLPDDVAETRRYRFAVGDRIESHLAVEDVLRPEASAEARAALAVLPALRGGDKPLVDGHELARAAEMPMGRRLGRLKSWLHRMQIELDLDDTEEILGLLDIIDWQNGDAESWPGPEWP